VETLTIKKGHAKWLEQQNIVNVDIEDEYYDDPVMLQHIFDQNPHPSNDPMHNHESMVYIIGKDVIFCCLLIFIIFYFL
jgi:hypothetical protein